MSVCRDVLQRKIEFLRETVRRFEVLLPEDPDLRLLKQHLSELQSDLDLPESASIIRRVETLFQSVVDRVGDLLQ